MSLKILLFDENVSDLMHMDQLLSECDVEVSATADRQRAAMMANSETFDGIFIGVPSCQDSKFSREVRQTKRNITTPIIAISDASGKPAMTEAFRDGASFFLQKPVDRARIRLLINSSRGAMLENRRLLERAPVFTKVSCRVSGATHLVSSCNISGRGILLDGIPGVDVGSNVQLGFRLPHHPIHIETSGLIVRVDEQGRMGISFIGLKATDRQRIKIYVSEELHRRSEKPAAMKPTLQFAYA